WEALTWPDVAALARRNPPTTAFIERYRARQRAAGRDDRVQRVWVPHAAIASGVKRAVLVGEDINFFSHRGFDYGEIRLAVPTPKPPSWPPASPRPPRGIPARPVPATAATSSPSSAAWRRPRSWAGRSEQDVCGDRASVAEPPEERRALTRDEGELHVVTGAF